MTRLYKRDLRLGDGARALGDGQSGGLGDGVSLVTVDNLGGRRAVGGVGSDNLGGVDDSGRSTGSESGRGGDGGELHFDGIKKDGLCGKSVVLLLYK